MSTDWAHPSSGSLIGDDSFPNQVPRDSALWDRVKVRLQEDRDIVIAQYRSSWVTQEFDLSQLVLEYWAACEALEAFD